MNDLHNQQASAENPALVDALIKDPPQLHVWSGRPRIGGMGGDVGRRLVRNIRARPPMPTFEVIETGAGLSTLLLLALGVTRITSIDPTPGLRERVEAEASRRGLATTHLEFISQRS